MRTLRRKFCLACGTATVAAAVLPPLSNVASQLFAAHMVQHLLVIAVASPLLAAGDLLGSFAGDKVVDRIAQPTTGWIAFVSIFLLWHWPVAFQWAARGEASSLLEHATILCGALLFWSVVFSPKSQAWFSYGARALFVMTAALATDLPGVIMVFSPRAICFMPGENASAWGMTPLEDQQLAGLFMWVPANLIFFSIATFLFALWISDHPTSHRPVTS